MGNESSKPPAPPIFWVVNETERDLVVLLTDDPNALLVLEQWSKTNAELSYTGKSGRAQYLTEDYVQKIKKDLARAWLRMETVPKKTKKSIDIDTADFQASMTVYAKRKMPLPGYLLVAYQKKVTRGGSYEITEGDCKAAPEVVDAVPKIQKAVQSIVRKEQTF